VRLHKQTLHRVHKRKEEGEENKRIQRRDEEGKAIYNNRHASQMREEIKKKIYKIIRVY
jgi:hypothetical protein